MKHISVLILGHFSPSQIWAKCQLEEVDTLISVDNLFITVECKDEDFEVVDFIIRDMAKSRLNHFDCEDSAEKAKDFRKNYWNV